MWKNIKKFRPSHCDLSTMIWNVSVTLRILTINIDSNYKKRITFFFYIFTGIISSCYFYVYGVSNTWFVLWRCRQTGDIVSAMIFFSIQAMSAIGPAKLIFIKFYRKNIREIVQSYLACDALVEPKSLISSRLLTYLRKIKKRAIIFWFIVNVNGFVYIIKPLLLPGQHFMNDNQVLLGLEPLWESPNYEIAYTVTATAVMYSCYLSTHITALFLVPIGYNESKLLALSDRLTHLWNDAEDYYKNDVKSRPTACIDSNTINIYEKNKNYIKNQFVRRNLIEIMNYHTRNITLVKQVEKVFRGCIAVEFCLLMAALVAILLGGLKNTYIQLPFSLLSIAIYCLVGQRLLDANNTFSDALYGCQWENFDVKNMKTVLLMLTNARKPLTLSAGGVTILNFVTLGGVFKSIFSSYATLRSVVNLY